MQPAPVAQSDLAAGVDAIFAHPVVSRDDEARDRRRGPGTGFERHHRGPPPKGPVGTAGVVVLPEPVELRLELSKVPRPMLLSEPPLLGLVEPLDFAAGLGVVGRGVAKRDAERIELDLDGAPAAASR